jgi:hypothetical protein
MVRDAGQTTKNQNMHDYHYWRQFYDAPSTTAKNYFLHMTISIPAAATIFIGAFRNTIFSRHCCPITAQDTFKISISKRESKNRSQSCFCP